MDVRVHDYLDDKIQTLADLDSLDALLDAVKDQQTLLKQQLNDVQKEHARADQDAKQSVESIRHQTDDFQKLQTDIDKRLLIITQSETSDDAVRVFEASMARLQKLDLAEGYLELLEHVQELKSQSLAQLGKSDVAVIQPYTRLQKLAADLRPLQDAAEGAAPHLVDAINREVGLLRSAIQDSFSADFEKTLKKLNWPRPLTAIPLALEAEWRSNINRLLSLQRPELEIWVDSHPIAKSDAPVLLPLRVMMRSLEQRFVYHFSGNKPTNRLDKPEYFLTHTLETISTHAAFIEEALQSELLRAFRGSGLAKVPAFIDATSAFINAALPMVQTKLTSFAPQLEGQPQLLSHLIHELMTFDEAVRETYAYAPVDVSVSWQGLSYFLLETQNYFQKWLTIEGEFALSRYQAIIDSSDAGELDYDSLPGQVTKPSKAAIRVNDLLETITERYRPLTSFSQKLRFLIDIQIAIFDRFHTRLHSSLEAFISMTSTIGRTVHGVSKADQTELQGVKGIERLCRVFGSAEYLEQAMRDWSDDVFFLELWDELQLRSKDPAGIDKRLGGLEAVQAKTSSSVGEADGTAEESHGALFDETAAAYRHLRVRSEAIIIETVIHSTKEALRQYGRSGNWASISSNTAANSVSAGLEPTLRLLGQYLGFLHGAIGPNPLRRVVRQVGAAIQSFIWDSVLLRNSFSTTGAAQLASDVDGLCRVLEQYVGQRYGRMAMRKLDEGVILLGLPITSGQKKGMTEDEDAAWTGGEDGDEAKTDAQVEAHDAEATLGLFEAERLVFANNESARSVLERLGLTQLTEADARLILRKRIEIGS